MRTVLSWLVGLGVLTGLGFCIGVLTGPATCRDGWASPSIGMQGACSHHGGVRRGPAGFLFIVALGLAGYAGVQFHGSAVGKRLDRKRRDPPNVPLVPSVDFPPRHEDAPPARPAAPHPKQRISPPSLRSPPVRPPPRVASVLCPACDKAMIKRTARFGHHKGKRFWGCSAYPACTGTRAFTAKR